jgi:hypothetical protein
MHRLKEKQADAQEGEAIGQGEGRTGGGRWRRGRERTAPMSGTGVCELGLNLLLDTPCRLMGGGVAGCRTDTWALFAVVERID